MLDAMIGVTVTVYHGPTYRLMVRAWSCPPCGVREWRDDTVSLRRLSDPVGATS